MKKQLLLAAFLIALFSACNKDPEEILPDPIPDPVELTISPEVALKWNTMTLYVIKNSPSNSPTYASRALGYIGLTMYESVVNGSIIFKSITSDLNGLGATPKPEVGQEMDWEIALNAGQSEILKSLYAHAPEELSAKVDSLYASIIDLKKAASVSQATIDASDLYGKLIARQIFEWSKLDNGHESYKNTFDLVYPYPKSATTWSPPVVGQASIPAPLHPYWGNNRNFVPKNQQMPIPAFIESNRDTASAYYKEMKLVYNKNMNLTQAEKETALWWGDDPSASASPPGHSYYLAAILVADKKTNLFEATSVFAKVGMAVAEAFINVFRCKYFYHSERPRNYIIRNIDGSFNQFWPEPPFPAFISGHSTQAAAAATVLISVYGDKNSITDEFHTGRPKDSIRNVEFKTKHYDSIWGFAEDCGWSRILGGIHMPQDNVAGLAEGKEIGENIAALGWKH